MAKGMRQLLICAGAFVVYFAGRWLVEGSEATAISNAQWMLRLEASLGLDIEQALQEYALPYEALRILGNLSYVWLHWPLIVVAMVLLYQRDPVRYLRLRNALMASALIGIVIFAVFPEAPPRFLAGYTGTVDDAARRLYLGTPMSWNNQYASFVSFHVGWTLIACLAVAASVERRIVKEFLLLPAALTSVAVVITGNHFIVDAIAGAFIAVTAYLATGSGSPGWLRAQLSRLTMTGDRGRRIRRTPGSTGAN